MKENSVAKTLQIIGYVELIAAFILALIIALLLITYIPGISLLLPKLIYQ